MKTKIYLAKSNRSNPDDLSRVRQVLSKHKEHIEVVEFTGGGYSHKPLLECDVLLIVPDLSEYQLEHNWVNLGKGLHEQICAFERQNPNSCDILFVTEATNKHIAINTYQELDLADCDDYINYSAALIDDQSEPLESILVNRFGCDEYADGEAKVTLLGNEFMYLLIRR